MSISQSDRVAFLKKIHLFYGLEDGALQTIAAELDEQSVQKGEVVFKQDSDAKSFYMIYGGSVRIVRRQDGREIQLALLVQHDYFGELALVSRRRRSATVTALEDSSLLLLSRKDFDNLFKQRSDLKNNLAIAVRSRLLARRRRFAWLASNEVIYFLARKHPILLYEKLILPFLTLIAPLLLLYAWMTYVHSFIVLFAGGASLLANLFWIGWRAVDWGNDYYIVTNQRVIWLEKVILLYDSRQEAPLSNILAVDVDTTQLGRILDYGDVVMRTYVGKIIFNNVSHPEQAARMIEEYWERTKVHAVAEEKEAMKDAIRKRLGLRIPDRPKPDGKPESASPPRRGILPLLRFLGANTLKVRYEQGDNVYYRKHWFVLIRQAVIPLACVLGIFGMLVWRSYQLFRSSTEAWIQIVDGKVTIDTYFTALLLSFIPFILWIIYETMDWSNDRFEVTAEQIIDIDRKPFGNESRNAAQLENILSTFYERRGFMGYLFNFGTVYITVGGAKLAFEDVMDPATVQSDIDRRRVARKRKQDESRNSAERDRMAEWLATYHHNAEEFRKAEEEKRNQNGPA